MWTPHLALLTWVIAASAIDSATVVGESCEEPELQDATRMSMLQSSMEVSTPYVRPSDRAGVSVNPDADLEQITPPLADDSRNTNVENTVRTLRNGNDAHLWWRSIALPVVAVGSAIGYIVNLKFEDNPSPRLHLVTNRGFVRQFLLSLVSFGAMVQLSGATNLGVDFAIGNGFELWAALGFVSSSIQLLLNLLSIGRASLNTYLGPLRPGLIGLSAVLQVMVWVHARESPDMLRIASTSTNLFLLLVFLPEGRELYHRARKLKPSQCAGGVTMTTVVLSVEGMRCAASSTSVMSICDAEVQVLRSEACFESKEVRCLTYGDSKDVAEKICMRLSDAGFGLCFERVPKAAPKESSNHSNKDKDLTVVHTLVERESA